MEKRVTYSSRRTVLPLLLELIQKTLSPTDCRFLFLYCGYPNGEPQGLRELAGQFSLRSSQHAQNALIRIVSTVRSEIPQSPLAPYLRGMQSLSELDGSGWKEDRTL